MATIIVIENSEPRHYELCDQVLCPGTQFPRALVPGLNQVDADAWAAVKNVPAVAGLIAAGVLREVPAAAPPAP